MDTILFNLIWIIPLFTVLVGAPIPAAHPRFLKTIHAFSATTVLAIVCYLTYRVYAMSGIPADEAAAPLVLRFFTDIPWKSTGTIRQKQRLLNGLYDFPCLISAAVRAKIACAIFPGTAGKTHLRILAFHI